ncbi:hypothetical protein AVEN_251581-1 [Araneus ventricosus]|uniref:Uncharacterized protein n=1 Tax=Araneus ventricosus TaxID=182803 RepID=A0A4Y2R7X9_ARAVE|nr:hypothetical protein AVEN_251581-1 [Araneus ventricosus]
MDSIRITSQPHDKRSCTCHLTSNLAMHCHCPLASICGSCTAALPLSVHHENCCRQNVYFMAVAIETGYGRKNPFLVGRSSFKCATLAHLAPNGLCMVTEKTND